jgi:hypothetical protein
MRYLFAALLAWAVMPAQADIYKHVDEDGHVTYSNTPRPGAKRIIADPGSPKAKATSNAPRPKASSNPTPADFPRVDTSTQRQRDDVRRQLLLDELKAEQGLLATARSSLATKQGKPGPDTAKLDESIRLHEHNIEMLNKELAHLK